MSNKELILQEIEQMPESISADCLQLLRKFIAAHQQVSSESPVSQEAVRPEVMDAYFESITEREEVYRRLADS
jgi:hypothetical protein